jgi:hypothetical protein
MAPTVVNDTHPQLNATRVAGPTFLQSEPDLKGSAHSSVAAADIAPPGRT